MIQEVDGRVVRRKKGRPRSRKDRWTDANHVDHGSLGDRTVW